MPYNFVERLAGGASRRRRNPWLWLNASLIVLTALLLAGSWRFTLDRFAHEERLVIEQARIGQQNLAHSVAGSLRQILDRGALYALVASEWFRDNPNSAATSLTAMLTGDRAYTRVALFDSRGRQVFASSATAPGDETVAAVGRLLAESASAAPPAMRLGPLASAYDESWQIPLLLPVPGATDRAAGVLVMHLDLGFLLRLYQDIDIGRSGIIQILQVDGLELARARRGGLEIDSPQSVANPLPADRAAQGSRIMPLLADGKPYVISFRRLGAFPFAVAVDNAIDDILAEFRAQKSKELAWLSLLTAIALLVTTWAIILVRRQQRHFEALGRSEQEKLGLIAQLEEEKRRAHDLAAHDHLTSLVNRRMFMELAASHLARGRRSRHNYALMFIDLDRFKAINDSLGHRVGDLLLQTVSLRLRAALRESDVIGRFGGDEFVVLLTGLQQETDVVAIAEKLLAAISEPCVNLDGHDVQVFPSIGIALYPRDSQDLDSLIRHADVAMYQSKKGGRGAFTFFDPALNVNSAHDFELEQRLPRAIADNEFVLHYQPKVRLPNYRIGGFETLIRWQHPDHGLLFPNDFIPLAEATGHIVALGDWVIATACRQLCQWRKEGVPMLPVAINLSAKQLVDPSLPSRIGASLAANGIAPEFLEVEITESSLVENLEGARAILAELVAAGVKVALDDFGNGFSSLGYIRTLPIDTIKIDRGFIKDIQNSPDDAIIVESTIILAHNLGLRVVAEGVETRDQLIHLKTAGCDEVQGYYFSRPVPSEQARELLLQPEKTPS